MTLGQAFLAILSHMRIVEKRYSLSWTQQSNLKILKPKNIESTSIGIAAMAGLKRNLYNDINEIIQYKNIELIYQPKITKYQRNKKLRGWNKAIQKI